MKTEDKSGLFVRARHSQKEAARHSLVVPFERIESKLKQLDRGIPFEKHKWPKQKNVNEKRDNAIPSGTFFHDLHEGIEVLEVKSLPNEISSLGDSLIMNEVNLAELEKLVKLWKEKLKPNSVDSKNIIAESHSSFVLKCRKLILEHIENPKFNGTLLAKKMYISESQLYRKVKVETGKSTAVFIRSIRLDQAKNRLENRSLTVSEIAFDTGFNCPSYFSRVFTAEFGRCPLEFRKVLKTRSI